MKYALLFPGQGSQAVGMLGKHPLADLEPTYREASEVLGWDLLKLVQEGPAEELNRTERTQPALLAAMKDHPHVARLSDVPHPPAAT